MNILKTVPVNTVGRDFVVGDLHGCFDLLTQALAHVEFNAALDRLFSVGDLVDRGPFPLECLRLLNEPWFFAVRGNHDDMTVGYFNVDPGASWLWPMNGGMWHEDFSAEQLLELNELLPKLDALPLMLTVTGKFHVMHAELQTLTELTDEILTDEYHVKQLAFEESYDGPTIMWGRLMFRPIVFAKVDARRAMQHRSDVNFHKLDVHLTSPNLSPIYSGHTVLQMPTRITRQIGLDTGAFLVNGPDDERRGWAGLTLTEPATGKFWKTNKQGTQEVTLVEI